MRPAPRRVPFVSGTWLERERSFRADRFNLKLVDDTQGQDVERLLDTILESSNGRRIAFRAGPIAVIQIREGANVIESIIALQNSSVANYIEWAEPDFRVRSLAIPSTMPNDPLLTDPGGGKPWQWGMDPMGMGEAWAKQRGSASVIVVIVDSGFETGHPDLASDRYYFGGSFLDVEGSTATFIADGVFDHPAMPPEMKDEDGHGVGMTGVVAADCDNGTTVAGMNWASPIGICRALDDNGLGSCSTVLASVLQAIAYAQIEGINLVVNLSLNVSDEALRTTFISPPPATNTFQYMCEKAHDAGAILVCAGGNVGWSTSGTTPLPPASYAADPAFADTVLAVGLTYVTAPAGVPALAGEAVDDWSHQGVTVVAPGSTWPLLELGGATPVAGWGSSIAAAHASGLASLIWSHRPDFTAAEVIETIKSTAELPVFPVGADKSRWGYGRINAYAALRAVEKRPVISLVLDTSGSMAGASGTAGITRLQVLQGAAGILLHVTEGYSHVGVVKFSSAASTVAVATEIDPANPTATQDNLALQVNALAAAGQTAIGAGVLAGVDQVEKVVDAVVEGEPSRAVILMTDGRENSGPRVNPGPGEPAVDLVALAAKGIPVWSVGTGDTSVVDVDAMVKLAETTGGEYAVTGPWNADSEQQIGKFFCQALADIAGYTSLLDPSGTLSKTGGEEVVDFEVTRDEQFLEVILMKPFGAIVELALETPEGVQIDRVLAGQIGAEYRPAGRTIVMRLALPCIIPGHPAVAHAGKWHANFSLIGGPNNTANYTLVVNARSRLSLEATVKQAGTAPGSAASVSARLWRDRKLLHLGNVRASVTVHRPNGSEVKVRLKRAAGWLATGWLAAGVRLPTAGAYRLSLRVAGTLDGHAFVREKLLTAATWTQPQDPGD